jgi:hypothetical protein
LLRFCVYRGTQIRCFGYQNATIFDTIIDILIDYQMSEWVSIADAKEIYGKSETTMRNLVRKLKASRSKDLKIDKSPNGRDIVRFKRTFLDSQYNISSDSQSDRKAPESADSEIVGFLKQQIEIKDKQIDQLSHLLYTEKENVKMLMLQSGDADASAKEKPQEVAKDSSAVWVVLLVIIVLVALAYSVLTLI